MADFPKILNHPDRDIIISKLSSGESPKTVIDWLKEKYPTNKNNHISHNYLDDFRRRYLNLHGTILVDLQMKLREQEKEELDTRVVTALKRNKTYDEKLNEIIDEQIDWRKRLLQLLNIIETRFSQLFDKTQLNPDNLKPDYVMIQWMQTMLKLVEDIRKVEGIPDQVIQHNVTVQAIDEQAAIFQQAIQKTIAELDLNTASILIDKLNNNIEQLKAQKSGTLIYSNKEMSKIKTLAATIVPEKK